jgi:hypothetical protein
MIKKPTQKDKILANAEDVIDMIYNDNTYRQIAKKYEVDLKVVLWFTSESPYSSRAKAALEASAEIAFDKAEEVLAQIKKGDDQALITRQRELAHHYRKKAGVKNRYRFSDKIQQDINLSMQDSFVLKRLTATNDINVENDKLDNNEDNN